MILNYFFRITKTDDLITSIWTDNIKFLNDKQILEHTYFNFVWQMCDQIPRFHNKQQQQAETCTDID